MSAQGVWEARAKLHKRSCFLVKKHRLERNNFWGFFFFLRKDIECAITKSYKFVILKGGDIIVIF